MTSKKRAINPWFIAVTVTLATFMELLDTSIANVALPYIGGGLGRSYDEVTWILTTYLVANAVILPMSAWLSRVFGRKTYYLGCVALFTLTSFFCGLAPSLGIMLSSRVLQGIAGGGLAPGGAGDSGGHVSSGQARIGVRSVHHRDCDRAGDRAGAGRLDHGQLQLALDLLHQYSDWLAGVFPEQQASQGSTGVRSGARLGAAQTASCSIDGIGITLIALASAALEVALDRGQIDDWFGSSFICWMLAIGVLGWIATVVWEMRLKEPVIDFRLLASRNFAIASALVFRVRIRAVRQHDADSADAAIALWISGDRCGAGAGSGRARDHAVRADRGAVDPAPDCARPRAADRSA